MSSVRQNIIDTLTSDLMNIQIANGYSSNMKDVRYKLLPNEVTMFPSAGYIIESDEHINYLTEDLNLELRKIIIQIAVYTNEENKILAVENIISDLNKLFKDDDSILPIYQSQINQISGVWVDGKNKSLNVDKINQITDAGIAVYNISLYYISEYNGNSNYSNSLPVIPNILNIYSLTSHQHSGYATTASLANYSLTGHTHLGGTVDLTGYSLTSHLHNEYSDIRHTHNEYSETNHSHAIWDLSDSSLVPRIWTTFNGKMPKEYVKEGDLCIDYAGDTYNSTYQTMHIAIQIYTDGTPDLYWQRLA